MKYLFLSFLILTSLYSFSQNNDIIKIAYEKNQDTTLIYAVNSSTDPFTVELNVTVTGLTLTRACPITETLQGGEKKFFTSVIADKGVDGKYSISMSYGPASNGNQEVVAAPMEPTVKDLSKGVFVFSKEGCGRCQYVEKYLNDKKISFTKLNITKNDGDSALMWKSLKEAGFDGNSIQTPVIVLDGKVYYNQPDYKDIFKKIEAKY